jgi:transposase
LFVRQRTTIINALRAHLAELGIIAGIGRNGLERLLDVIADDEDERVPPNKIARTAWAMMAHGTYYKEPVVQAN